MSRFSPVASGPHLIAVQWPQRFDRCTRCGESYEFALAHDPRTGKAFRSVDPRMPLRLFVHTYQTAFFTGLGHRLHPLRYCRSNDIDHDPLAIRECAEETA